MTDKLSTPPAELLAPLLALVAKWHEQASRSSIGGDHMDAVEGQTLQLCADELQDAIASLAAHRGEVAHYAPLVQLTAPERIWLAVSDETHDEDNSFPSDVAGICWSDDEPLAVCIPYVRADVAAHPPQAQAGAGDAAMVRIGELIRTQDNRITDQPIFIVQQKRRICGMDEDYAEDFMWYDARAVESYDEAGKAERDADREAEGLPPIEWQRGGYIDTWEFVTACFTEQGCKDYIARDGHNLREPRIYAYGSYRNEEFRAVRKYLAALEASQ